ncbi:MAG: DUF885 family protein [Caulobacteraceae bacterium]
MATLARTLAAVLALGALSTSMPVHAHAQVAASQAPAAGSADARLKTLLDDEWRWRTHEQHMGADPDDVGEQGHLPHVDAASQQQRLAYWTGALKTLDTIPLDQLTPEDRINAAVFRTALEAFVARIRFKDYEDGFGFWTWMAPNQGFRTASAYRAYLSRLQETPRYVDEQIADMRAGLARGFTKPAVSIRGRDAPVVPMAATTAEQNAFYGPFAHMPESIPAAEREALQAQARTAISTGVAPAFGRLLVFLRQDYMPHARTTIAAEALPDGKAYYQAKVREFTTLDMTPEEIHQIGLKEVARIDADMHATMRQAGWTGDFQGFLKYLKTDPQFYAKTPYELIARSAYVANEVYGQLKFTFGLLPRYRFSITPTPAAMAPYGTGGNGGLDTCLMNTYNLPARPLYTITPLTLHECVPGHSFQAALALEAPDRPEIRKTTYFSGYGEGWALYMEWLGTKMGVYKTPYDEFGRETYEMWRAARLVVDTGLHHYGWSRQQALDYLSSHTALSDHEVEIEVDRYINTPGQALAYKLGEMLMRRKRAEAEVKLGARFDQRRFHDVILGLGAVPLRTLDSVLEDWIVAGGPDTNGAAPGA